MTVEVEHLVISPAPGQSRPAFDVLDVLRLAPGPWSAAGQALRIPLPAGYEGLRVIDGLVPASLQRQPDAVVGTIAKPGDGRQEGATVAIAYRIAGDALPHPWPVERPFTVGTLIILLDPGLQASVVGASAAGTVDVEGRSYQAFVREQAAAADAPVLLVLGSAAGAGGGRPAGLAWNAAGALGLMGAGAALVLVLRRRRGRGAVAAVARTPAGAKP
ncbi:MAG: hypothetical protein IMX02_09395 [Limnochordaceae bacterium]|nr:hypothetical protein [Limnochordaceae bacterium]